MLKRQGRKALPANLGQKRPAVPDMAFGVGRPEGSFEGLRGQPHAVGQFKQYRFVGDAAPLHVVSTLQTPQQLQPATSHLLGSQHRSDGWRRVEHGGVITQQTFEIAFTERLSAVFGNAPIMGHDVTAQLWRYLLPIGTRHHAAAVGNHGQHSLGGLHQRFGAVAPAAQWVVDVMQDHGKAPTEIQENSMSAG
ncbi:hypothetical protein D9M69_410770 [compost metagenome]